MVEERCVRAARFEFEKQIVVGWDGCAFVGWHIVEISWIWLLLGESSMSRLSIVRVCVVELITSL